MNAERNICRHSSQKQPEEKPELPRGVGLGQEAGPDLCCHRLLVPRVRQSLSLRALSHTDFLLPPGAGAQGLLWPPDLQLGIGRERADGMCVQMLCPWEAGGGVGEGSRELIHCSVL